mgnify:CR=1 FL=1
MVEEFSPTISDCAKIDCEKIMAAKNTAVAQMLEKETRFEIFLFMICAGL